MGDGKRSSALASQLGFYFCDANVRRDKFLRRHIGPRGIDEIAIDVLATFNRVQALSKGDMDAVREALMSLPYLQVSDDGLRVSRRRPLPTHDDSDERTVYLEPLSQRADRDEVQKAMEASGEVAYVSMPRLPSGDLKGFAFIEFSEPQAAIAACAPDAINATCAEAIVGEGKTLRVLHKHAWSAMTEAYNCALEAGRTEEHADVEGRAAADKASQTIMDAAAKEAERQNVVKISGIRKGVVVKVVRREMREVFERIAPYEFVDYGVSNAGDVTVGYVRMVTAEGAAEAIRILRDASQAFGGGAVQFELLRGEVLSTYVDKVTALRAQRAATSKVKRDKWWERKHSKSSSGGGGSGDGGNAHGDGDADGQAQGEASAELGRRLCREGGDSEAGNDDQQGAGGKRGANAEAGSADGEGGCPGEAKRARLDLES